MKEQLKEKQVSIIKGHNFIKQDQTQVKII